MDRTTGLALGGDAIAGLELVLLDDCEGEGNGEGKREGRAALREGCDDQGRGGKREGSRCAAWEFRGEISNRKSWGRSEMGRVGEEGGNREAQEGRWKGHRACCDLSDLVVREGLKELHAADEVLLVLSDARARDECLVDDAQRLHFSKAGHARRPRLHAKQPSLAKERRAVGRVFDRLLPLGGAGESDTWYHDGGDDLAALYHPAVVAVIALRGWW